VLSESSTAGYAPCETESAPHGDLLAMDDNALGSTLIELVRADHPQQQEESRRKDGQNNNPTPMVIIIHRVIETSAISRPSRPA
jgi:hypothetical protein